VLPVGLSFINGHNGQHSDAPLFVGDTTLLQSIWSTLRATGVQAVVHYGQAQHAEGRDRRTWAQALREAVAALREAR